MVRCLLGLAAWSISQYTSLSLVDDALLYETRGAQVAKEWLEGESSETFAMMRESGREPWIMVGVLAIFSFLLGGLRILPIIIVLYALITAWTPVLTYRSAVQLGISPRASLSAARLVMFSPVFSFWAGALYKEGLVLLALNAIVYHLLRLQQGVETRSILIVALGINLLLGLRFYMAWLLLPGVALGLLLGGRGDAYRGVRARARPAVTLLRIAFLVTTFVVIMAFLGVHVGLGRILPDDADSLLLQMQASRDDLASASSGYLHGVQVSTPLAAIRFLPLGILYFLTVPFPWQFGSLRQTLVLPEMVFWLFQYPGILRGMRLGLKRNFRGSVLLLALTGTMLCFYGIFAANAGTAYRLRAQVWLLWAPYLAWAKDATRVEREPQASARRPIPSPGTSVSRRSSSLRTAGDHSATR